MDDHEISKLSRQEDTYWWNILRKNLINYTISKNIKNAGKLSILDIGCGPGGTTNILSKFGNVTGADTSKRALEILNKRFPHIKGTLCNLDGTNFPFETAVFDLVTAFDVLEHIQKDTIVMSEMNRVLKPNGYVLVTVPAHPYLWSYRDVTLMHKRRYTKEELSKKLSENGFEVVSISWFNFFMFLPILIALLLSKVYAPKVNPESDTVVPTGNSVLLQIVKLETFLFKKLKLPIGVSLIALARKI